MIADISLNIARKELKIAQIAPLNQLFQLLQLVRIYGHGFCELGRMRKNVNSDVSKDSPIVISIPACNAVDRGSIPRWGDSFGFRIKMNA